MKVLMFGWEFPPHITGGLGTACYGLTKALSEYKDLDITFVVPKAYGDEDSSVADFVSAEEVVIGKKEKQKPTNANIETKEVQTAEESATISKEAIDSIKEIYNPNQEITHGEAIKKIKYIEISSLLRPYLSPELFEQINNQENKESKIKVNDDGTVVFTVNNEEIEIKVPSMKQADKKKKTENDKNTDKDNEEDGYRFSFSGKYGYSLITEVSNYAIVAGELARNLDFDLIHAHDWLTYPSGVAAKQISGKKLVIHVHATEFDRSGEHVNQVVYDIERYGIDNADLIITVSNLTRETVINKYGASPDKVVTVHNGVLPKEGEQEVYQKKINEKTVTFLGRITYQKGPEYFIEAAHKVLQRTQNVKFVMAGSGDLLYKMIRRAAELKIADKFHFTNFLKGKDVDRMFGVSDVYVMPSVSEPFGISPLEAMRSNVPVIISKQSGVAEVLKHAIKVDFWDVDAIADAIYNLITNNGLSEMFRRMGKQEVEEIKWDVAAGKVRDIYLEVGNDKLLEVEVEE